MIFANAGWIPQFFLPHGGPRFTSAAGETWTAATPASAAALAFAASRNPDSALDHAPSLALPPSSPDAQDIWLTLDEPNQFLALPQRPPKSKAQFQYGYSCIRVATANCDLLAEELSLSAVPDGHCHLADLPAELCQLRRAPCFHLARPGSRDVQCS